MLAVAASAFVGASFAFLSAELHNTKEELARVKREPVEREQKTRAAIIKEFVEFSRNRLCTGPSDIAHLNILEYTADKYLKEKGKE